MARDPDHADKIAAWRRAVFERDGYRCVVCGLQANQTRLVAHHILPRTYTKWVYDARAGLSMCQDIGCRAHDRAHFKARPYIYCYYDGQRTWWTADKSTAPSRRDTEIALANPAETC